MHNEFNYLPFEKKNFQSNRDIDKTNKTRQDEKSPPSLPSPNCKNNSLRFSGKKAQQQQKKTENNQQQQSVLPVKDK